MFYELRANPETIAEKLRLPAGPPLIKPGHLRPNRLRTFGFDLAAKVRALGNLF